MRYLFPLTALLLTACPGTPGIDAGTPDPVADAGLPPGPSCATSADCVDGVCRGIHCTMAALCTDDVECGLGEDCVDGTCRFTGCAKDSDCASGACRKDVFTCAECGTNAGCPTTRPVCDANNTCVQCSTDTQCSPPGPGHCDAPSGACVHCLEDKHCPNGLNCGAGHLCTGAKLNQQCPMGTACDSGLICVSLGGVNTCLNGCPLSAPTCKTGEICYKLTYSGGSGLVFDQGGPIGVCYLPQQAAKGYREACTRPAASVSTSNCQPNLTCIPDSPTLSVCRTFCDLNLSNACPPGEKCHPFKGDFNGRLYGICYADNGWGDPCFADSACKPNQSCTPYEDPSAGDDLSTVCQFAVGAAPGLAPCKNTPLPDGGTLLADKVCQSGACQADPLLSSTKFFCYSACKTNSDCSVAGRTGSCDGDFVFPAGVATGTVKGCRRQCASNASCAEYGAGITCRSRYVSGFTPSFATSCAPQLNGGVGGAACTTNTQCRSGFCLVDDGRASRRKGVCAEACTSAADCSDAGSPTGPLDCLDTAFIGFVGYDSVPNTTDDVVLRAKLCSGSTCASDDDCGDGGAACVPDVDPADAGRLLSLRCRPPHATGFLPGASTCSQDSDCVSGVCGTLQAPSTGFGRACLQSCTAGTVCPGTSTCRAGGLRVQTSFTTVSFNSCAP